MSKEKLNKLLLLSVSSVALFGASGNPCNADQVNVEFCAMGQDMPDQSCKGKNACKGKGNCKTDTHACKGQNACKGQGGCKGGAKTGYIANQTDEMAQKRSTVL